jgi:DNA-binding ferritin-like protein
MKAAEFVGKLFLARDVAHSVHLNTRSYAKHKALKTFYEDIVDMADEFAEAYMGKKGLIGQIPLLTIKKTGNIVEFLENQVEEIEKERYIVCDKTDTPIQNVIDSIIALYLSTLYKLKFLA